MKEPANRRDLMGRVVAGPPGPPVGEDDDDWRRPPLASGWRARVDGPARWLALVGVSFGFVLLVVPGAIARRQVIEWRAGRRYRPTLAWVLGAIAMWTAAMAVLMGTGFRGGAAVLGVIALPPLILWASRD